MCDQPFELCEAHAGICHVPAAFFRYELIESDLDIRADPESAGITGRAHGGKGMVRSGNKVSEGYGCIVSDEHGAEMQQFVGDFTLILHFHFQVLRCDLVAERAGFIDAVDQIDLPHFLYN